jgi:hypothetical protein
MTSSGSGIQVTRHWHVTEQSRRLRFLARTRTDHRLGADTALAAYRALAQRASQLMLEGWRLDVDRSSESVVAVERDGERKVITVTECFEAACLAARPPAGLPNSFGGD